MRKTSSTKRAAVPRTARTQGGNRRAGAGNFLNKDAIVVAALEEIDHNGLEEFSLRSLAKTLNVYPTAVAWHVSSRGQLLADVVALVLADILPPAFPESWQSYLRQFFHRFRDAIRKHPNITPLIGTQLVANRGVDLDFVERLLATLAHAGLSGTRLVGAYNAVIAALVGFTTQEFAPIPAEDTKNWQNEVRARLRNVQASRHPILAGNMKLLGNKAFILRWQNGTEAPLDTSFETFVDVFIVGLEQLASSR